MTLTEQTNSLSGTASTTIIPEANQSIAGAIVTGRITDERLRGAIKQVFEERGLPKEAVEVMYKTMITRNKGLLGDGVWRNAVATGKSNANTEATSYVVRAVIPDEHKALIEREYPEVAIQWKEGGSLGSHPRAAIARGIDNHLLYREAGRYSRILDISGNIVDAIHRGKVMVHCCDPVLDARDQARKTEKDISLKKMKDEMMYAPTPPKYAHHLRAFIEDEGRFHCGKKAEHCQYQAPVGVINHGAYDIPMERWPVIMRNHSLNVVHGAMIYTDRALVYDSGRLDALGMTYRVDKERDRIRFDFVGGSELPYEHRYSNYRRYGWNAYMVFDDVQYLYEIVGVRSCSIKFRVVRLSAMKVDKPLKLDLCIPSREGKRLLVKTWRYKTGEKNQATSFEPVEIVVAQRFWDLLLTMCARHPKELTVNVIMGFITSIKHSFRVNERLLLPDDPFPQHLATDVAVAAYFSQMKISYAGAMATHQFTKTTQRMRSKLERSTITKLMMVVPELIGEYFTFETFHLEKLVDAVRNAAVKNTLSVSVEEIADNLVITEDFEVLQDDIEVKVKARPVPLSHTRDEYYQDAAVLPEGIEEYYGGMPPELQEYLLTRSILITEYNASPKYIGQVDAAIARFLRENKRSSDDVSEVTSRQDGTEIDVEDDIPAIPDQESVDLPDEEVSVLEGPMDKLDDLCGVSSDRGTSSTEGITVVSGSLDSLPQCVNSAAQIGPVDELPTSINFGNVSVDIKSNSEVPDDVSDHIASIKRVKADILKSAKTHVRTRTSVNDGPPGLAPSRPAAADYLNDHQRKVSDVVDSRRRLATVNGLGDPTGKSRKGGDRVTMMMGGPVTNGPKRNGARQFEERQSVPTFDPNPDVTVIDAGVDRDWMSSLTVPESEKYFKDPDYYQGWAKSVLNNFFEYLLNQVRSSVKEVKNVQEKLVIKIPGARSVDDRWKFNSELLQSYNSSMQPALLLTNDGVEIARRCSPEFVDAGTTWMYGYSLETGTFVELKNRLTKQDRYSLKNGDRDDVLLSKAKHVVTYSASVQQVSRDCIFVCEPLQVLVGNVMLNRFSRGVGKRIYTPPEVIGVFTIAGAGKTFYIKWAARPGDIILTATVETQIEISEFIMWRGVPGVKVHTLDAYCMASGDVCDRLLVDEACMAHPGQLVYAINIAQPARQVLFFGDPKQIPFLDRLSIKTVKYTHFLYFTRIFNAIESGRCPASGLWRVRDIYTSGCFSRNPIDGETVFMVDMTKPTSTGAMPTIPKKVGNVVYLTMTKKERANLIMELYNSKVPEYVGEKKPGMSLDKAVCQVMTVHQAQGKTFDEVIMVRSIEVNIGTFSSLEHILVAMTRHVKKFTYYTVVPTDDMSRRCADAPNQAQIRSLMRTPFKKVDYYEKDGVKYMPNIK